MKPEDMEKWASRAQTVAAYSKKPMAAYQGCRSMLAKAGAGGLLLAHQLSSGSPQKGSDPLAIPSVYCPYVYARLFTERRRRAAA